jgi:uncharacterized OB-fold protein
VDRESAAFRKTKGSENGKQGCKSVLSKIYPICSYCKKVREETGQWVSVEKYVRDLSGAMPSHGVCPQCYERELNQVEKHF